MGPNMTLTRRSGERSKLLLVIALILSIGIDSIGILQMLSTWQLAALQLGLDAAIDMPMLGRVLAVFLGFVVLMTLQALLRILGNRPEGPSLVRTLAWFFVLAGPILYWITGQPLYWVVESLRGLLLLGALSLLRPVAWRLPDEYE